MQVSLGAPSVLAKIENVFITWKRRGNDGLEKERQNLLKFIAKLKDSSPEDREKLLASSGEQLGAAGSATAFSSVANNDIHAEDGLGGGTAPSDEDDLDIAHFISLDETGKPRSFGPSSAYRFPGKGSDSSPSSASAHRHIAQDQVRDSLIANAALQRQSEYGLHALDAIEGVPIHLAMRLLNLHWTRQHHTFLLTYRPAIMRDLIHGGPSVSPFMLNAIFACVSKFSGLPEVREDPNDPASAGRQFFKRCDELLARDSLLIRPSIPTVIGLLLLGSTFVARGETSKGWLYTGYALRMVYDLGLHLDPQETTDDPEEVEIRRRVFWGAFVCDKLQSLYLGRPVAINLRDSQVSRKFLDLYEERDLFALQADANGPDQALPPPQGRPTPLYSVSTFQQLCSLSKIMTMIIDRFYVVGATFSNAKGSLETVDKALQKWKENLPRELDYQPWVSPEARVAYPAPNIMILHCLFHALTILVHRPFISDGHLRAASGGPARSWENCTTASRRIISLVSAYEVAWGLTASPYVLAYSIYVACTIHVRNAASHGNSNDSPENASLLATGLQCLDRLSMANPGVQKPAAIIRKLVELNGLQLNSNELPPMDQSSPTFDLEAILNMFPMPRDIPTEHTNGENAAYANRFPSELDPLYDPLFGLMDGFSAEADYPNMLP